MSSTTTMIMVVGRAAILALSLGVAAMTGLPAQAAPVTSFGFQLNFGTITQDGVTIQFKDGRFTNNYCLTTTQLRRSLRDAGYSNIVIVKDLGNHRLLVTAQKASRWYQMRVNTCTGLVDRVQRIYRSGNGSFTLSFNFGTIPTAPKEELVCLVTFFERGQVAAGADADVESAQILPRSVAQSRNGPNDRREVFDYGTDQQTINTCSYLDRLNN